MFKVIVVMSSIDIYSAYTFFFFLFNHFLDQPQQWLLGHKH